MKSLMSKVLLNTLAIMLLSFFIPGISFSNNLTTLFTASLVLALLNAVVKPFIKVLLLPLNIITLGIAGWFVNAIVLYILAFLVPGFYIQAFEVTFFTTIVFNVFWSYVVISFLLNLVIRVSSWILKT